MALSVTALTKYIKTLIESDENLSNVIVEGEISNFTLHRASGHMYFSLKDDGAVINAVMFRSSAQALDFVPKNGLKVLVKGRISLYEKSGQYQIYVARMKEAGLGDLHVAFEKLKVKLYEEGLFAAEHKLSLPQFPQTIGVITSKSGAAVKDILNILSRRYPVGRVILYPVLVQGDGAVDSMVTALDYFETGKNVDVIIIGRGGGSIEDLWAFNEEKLARKIYAMTIPVISAVGHETDTTICDYVADLRAPTPSAAAELAVPDLSEIGIALNTRLAKLQATLKSKTAQRRDRLERLLKRRPFISPESMFDQKRISLDKAVSALAAAGSRSVNDKKLRLAVLAERIDAKSPIKLFTAGYSIAALKSGKKITSVGDIAVGDDFTLTVKDGTAGCRVESIITNG